MSWNSPVFDSTGKIKDARLLAPSAPSSWLGIPNPQTRLGYDALGEIERADPIVWPSSESIGDYYIDSTPGNGGTDINNTYGYPDQPRLTIPATPVVDGGRKMVIVGDGNIYSLGHVVITGTAVAGILAWIVGRSATDIMVKANWPKIISGAFVADMSYAIVEHVWVNYQDNQIPILQVGEYSTCRHCIAQGTRVPLANGVNGTGVPVRSNSVYIDVESYDFGDETVVSSGDYHCFKPGDGVSYTWLLNCHGRNSQGDFVQFGEAAGTAANTTNHYVGGGSGHDCKENSIDVKRAQDVIISSCEHYNMGFQADPDSDQAIVLHDGCSQVWLVNNFIHSSNRGIEMSGTGTTELHILGNVFRDINAAGGTGGPFQDRGVAIIGRAGSMEIHNNTFHNVRKAIEHPGNPAGIVRLMTNNLFNSRNIVDTDSWDIMFENSTAHNSFELDYNMYDDLEGFRGRVSSTDFETLVAWVAATPHDDNSSIDDPLFTDAANNDFTLQVGSPAIAACDPSKPQAYADFFTRYGISIEEDINGVARPANGADWDIGAYQRAA